MYLLYMTNQIVYLTFYTNKKYMRSLITFFWNFTGSICVGSRVSGGLLGFIKFLVNEFFSLNRNHIICGYEVYRLDCMSKSCMETLLIS